MKPPMFVLALVALLVGCSSPKRVSATRFAEECRLGANQTVVSSAYLGTHDGRAYLSRRTMPLVGKGEWKDEIWYTPVSEMGPGLLAELEAKRTRETLEPRAGASQGVPEEE